MKIKIASISSLVVAGMAFSAMPVAADPYEMWHEKAAKSIQQDIKIDTRTDNSYRDNSTYSDDDEIFTDSSWRDNSTYEDNDRLTTQIDNSDHSDRSVREDFDFDYSHETTDKEAEALLLQLKVASQDAGHEQAQDQYSAAEGHDVATQGSANYLDVGNDTSAIAGPVFTNNNQYTPTNVIVDGDAVGLDVITKVAGRDLETNRGMIGVEVGATEVGVFGDTMSSNWGEQGAQGDSANTMTDRVDYGISQ